MREVGDSPGGYEVARSARRKLAATLALLMVGSAAAVAFDPRAQPLAVAPAIVVAALFVAGAANLAFVRLEWTSQTLSLVRFGRWRRSVALTALGSVTTTRGGRGSPTLILNDRLGNRVVIEPLLFSRRSEWSAAIQEAVRATGAEADIETRRLLSTLSGVPDPSAETRQESVPPGPIEWKKLWRLWPILVAAFGLGFRFAGRNHPSFLTTAIASAAILIGTAALIGAITVVTVKRKGQRLLLKPAEPSPEALALRKKRRKQGIALFAGYLVAFWLLSVAGAAVANRVYPDYRIEPYRDYVTFTTQFHHPLKAGAPWGIRCAPLVIRADPATVDPQTMQAIIAAVQRARDQGVQVTAVGYGARLGADAPSPQAIVGIWVHSTPDPPKLPGGTPERMNLGWTGQRSDGNADILVRMNLDLFSASLGSDPVQIGKATDYAIAGAMGVFTSTHKGTAITTHIADAAPTFSALDIQVMKKMSGCA